MIKMCSFCKQIPPMIRCRDCEQPAACFQCTISKPTGGFCLDHYRRFIRLHWENHKEECCEMDKSLPPLEGGRHTDAVRPAS